MATLEKIRKRSTLLLIVVGLALLAFIVGDFFTSGRTLFGNGTTIAKVGNTKIDIQDFQRRYEEVNQRLQQQQNNKQDPAYTQYEVLNGMIQDIMIENEIEALGIMVSDEELSKAMFGATAHPMMYQFAAQLGAETPDQVYDFAFNPVKYGVPSETASQLQALWLDQENKIERMLKIGKLQNLLSGTIVANELDAQAMYDANASTNSVAFVARRYSDVQGEEYNPTAAEVKKQYEKDKARFSNPEERRNLSYIAVPIVPSADDRAEAQVFVDSISVLLSQLPELEAVNGDANFGVDRRTSTSAAISNPLLRSFVTDSVAGAVKTISYIDDEFIVAKLLDKKMAVDSINVDVIAYEGTTAGRDSLMAMLQNGKTAADVAEMEGVAEARADLWQSLAAINDKELNDRLLNAPQGYFYLDSTATQARIVRVNTKRAPVQVYDYATVSYKVYPSDATIDKLNEDLNEFAATVAVADSLTSAKAMAAGYTVIPAYVNSSSYMLGSVPYSRNAVKWAMEAKPGQVSPVLENSQNDYLMLVTLNEIVPAGYFPLSNKGVQQMVEQRASNSKKADAIIAKHKDSNLEALAQEFNMPVDTTEITFGQMYAYKIGPSESELIGQVSVTPAGTTVAFPGNDAVYFYQVTGTDTESRPYNYEENAVRFGQQYGVQAVMQNLIDIMLKKNKVDNRILKFYND